ncbi:MAG: hypothetical protein KAQ92_08330 [Candidatus Aenigmarchaeota archaeon]|nr:hypothetical protein [Candidatus Aenigmarchaeota archaeon]
MGDEEESKKYKTTITVCPLKEPNFDFFLESLYRGKQNIILPSLAKDFLKKMDHKDSKDYFERERWCDYCKDKNISKTTYYTMINKLVGVGMIEVEEKKYYVKSKRAEIFFDGLSISIKKYRKKNFFDD